MKETKGQKLRFGTCHFENYSKAQKFYGQDVETKVRDGEIKIGPPKIGRFDKLSIDADGRYWIIS